jgi:hypothetical protein
VTRIKPLFTFDIIKDSDEKILLKFSLWARNYFPRYFSSKDAQFHKEIDQNNLATYKGDIASFVDIAFRGAAKTARTKLFIAFCISNDLNHYRRYIKVLSADGTNSKQIVTDIYNMLVTPQIQTVYPEIFEKTEAKREETMASFTTSTGIKITADTVGTEQRGAIQEDARPDWILFEDFETRTTLRSAKKSKAIWENMEEARTGLSKTGSCIYNCNYISELGNVHQLVQKKSDTRRVLIVPILTADNKPAWDRYSMADIEQMRKDDDDFEGERLCKPSASKDILFDREVLDKMEVKRPVEVSAGFRIYKKYDPSHRYGSGHDVAGGVLLDSSTSIHMDFDCVPAQVVGVFDANDIKPEAFGDEIYREQNVFPGIAGIENNKYDQAILKAKQLGVTLYKTERNELKVNMSNTNNTATYGWNTNSLTKPKMVLSFVKAVSDGLVALNDERLIAEAKSFSRNDLIDSEKDPRLTTRHFDLLMGACICWQMKDFAEVVKKDVLSDVIDEAEVLYPDIGL